MKRFYTAESVTEGHPDKVCDQIADTILDACLKEDPDARVACEVLATKGTVLLAGEITSRYEPDVLGLAEGVVEHVPQLLVQGAFHRLPWAPKLAVKDGAGDLPHLFHQLEE